MRFLILLRSVVDGRCAGRLQRYAVCALGIPLAVSCAERRTGTPAQREKLPAGVVARIENQAISADTVRRIAAAQHITLVEARDRAIRDALFALGASERLAPARVRSIERAVLARGVLEELMAQALKQGLPTASELDAIVSDRWYELDRPSAVRTTHAVVRVSAAVADEKLHRIAERIAEAVRAAKTPKEFSDRARAVPTEDVEVRVETLPFVTMDGRTFLLDKLRASAQKASFDVDFARAANSLTQTGEISPIVKTRFGYHIIYLEERLPERRLSSEERRALLTDEAISRRAERLKGALFVALEQASLRSTTRAVDDLTASVPVKR